MSRFEINKRKQVTFDPIDFQIKFIFKILFKSKNWKFRHDLFVYRPRGHNPEVAKPNYTKHGNIARQNHKVNKVIISTETINVTPPKVGYNKLTICKNNKSRLRRCIIKDNNNNGLAHYPPRGCEHSHCQNIA